MKYINKFNKIWYLPNLEYIKLKIKPGKPSKIIIGPNNKINGILLNINNCSFNIIYGCLASCIDGNIPRIEIIEIYDNPIYINIIKSECKLGETWYCIICNAIYDILVKI